MRPPLPYPHSLTAATVCPGLVSRQGDPTLPSAPCRRPGSRCREGHGWACSQWGPGEEAGSALVRLTSGGLSPYIQWVLEVVIHWGASWIVVAGNWKRRNSQLSCGIFILYCVPQTCSQTRCILWFPLFHPRRSWTTVMNKACVSLPWFPTRSIKNRLFLFLKTHFNHKNAKTDYESETYYDVTS